MPWIIAHCEDVKIERDVLEAQLHKWARLRKQQVTLFSFEDANRLLGAWKDTDSFDALILDIELPGLDGVTLAENVRKKDGQIPIIFVTNHSHIMPKGFALEAIDFLIKPLVEESFFAAMDRLVNRLDHRGEDFFTCRIDREIVRYPLRKIYFFVSDGHYVTINEDSAIRFREKMDPLEARLPKNFVRLHRSIIVNMDHIHQYGIQRVIMDDEQRTEHPIGKNYTESFIKAITEYRRFF